MTVTLPSNRSAYASYDHQSTNYSTQTVITTGGFDFLDPAGLYVGFDTSSVPAADRKKPINGYTLWAYAELAISYIRRTSVYFYPINSAWNESTLTYSNAPTTSDQLGWFDLHTRPAEWSYCTPTYFSNSIRSILSNGCCVRASDVNIYTSRHPSLAPYLEIELDDEQATRQITSASPSSGYKPKNTAVTVSWSSSISGLTIDTPTITATKMRYRENSSATATEVDCGGREYGTIPASAMTGNSIQWQGETTDSFGNTVTSGWYTLSTVEGYSTATADSPVNVMVDGSVDNVFRWTHRISTGTAPTRSFLEKSTDGTNWTTLLDQSGSATQGVVPAGSLPSGSVQWRVRTYNTENAAGYWSTAQTIMVVAAPDTPPVSVEQSPRPTVSWQSSEQQGYQVRIAGVYDSGCVFGTAQNMKLPVIVPDDEYIVEVRVVNEYGLWSEWGSAPLIVSNIPGEAITLTANTTSDIELSWDGNYDRYLVERDGNPIAVTTQTNYIDRKAVGPHTYRVLGLTDGSDNYGISNTAEVDLKMESNAITDLDTGETLSLRYSTADIQEEQIKRTREIALTHLGASPWPTAEIGKSQDKIITLEAAFSDLAEARKLDAMLGHLVCVKCKNDEIVVGVLPGYNKVSSAFWVNYQIEVHQTDDDEEVEL